MPALGAAAGYFAYHVVRDEASAERVWRTGATSLLLPNLTEIPIADLAIEVVAINGSSVGSRGAEVLTEAVRMLAPAGLLVLAEVRDLGQLGASPLASAVLEKTSFGNVYRRKVGMGLGLPPCVECGSRDRNISKGKCQPYVDGSFLPVTEKARTSVILAAPSVDIGRLRSLPMENILRTSPPGNHTWATRTKAAMPRWFAQNYVSVGHFRKEEFNGDFQRMIKDGSVRSLLDAGAGSCTLDAMLRDRGLMPKLKQYVAFGAYDCSMLRVCAERGTISLDYNWLSRLPFCKHCLFDMVFQAEGMHHLQTREEVVKTLDHFTKQLACGGKLVMDDGLGRGRSWNWLKISEDYLRPKGYKMRHFRNINPGLVATKPAC